MKKITVVLLAVVFLLVSGFSALAAPFTGGTVTVDVPDGWTPSFGAGSLAELRLMAPGNTFRMNVILGPSTGKTPEQEARMLSKKLGGTEPVASKSPGIYTFEVPAKGLSCVNMAKGKRMLVIMEAGNGEPFQHDVGRIMKSLTSTDSDEQAIFDSLKPFFSE